MQPARFEPPGRRPAVEIRDHTEAEDLVRTLIDELAFERSFAVAPRPLESAVHEDESGPRVIFLLNPSGERLDGELHLPFPCRLTDALSDDVFEGEGSLAIPIDARSCRMLLCDRLERISSRPRVPSARAGRSA
jgi:hypothetical protein